MTRSAMFAAIAWLLACGGDDGVDVGAGAAGMASAGATAPLGGTAPSGSNAMGGTSGAAGVSGVSGGATGAGGSMGDAGGSAGEVASGDAGGGGQGGGAAPVAGQGPGAGSGGASEDPSPGPEEGYAAYIEAFNTRDQAAVRATRAFPILNVLDGTVSLDERSESHVTVFPGPPWDHSATESLRVIHASDNFAHLDAVYSRRDSRDQVFTIGRGIYGMQKTDAGWKVKITSTVGSGSTAPPDGTAPAGADALIDAYFAALNRGDEDAVTALIGYPFARVDDGASAMVQSAAAHELGLDALRGIGWAQSRVDEVRAIVATSTAVHYAVRASCLDANGSERSVHEGLYLAVSLGGRWLLKLVSALSPICA